MASFDEMYKPALSQLPRDAWPQSTSHGKHSYTVHLGWNYLVMVMVVVDLTMLFRKVFKRFTPDDPVAVLEVLKGSSA